MTNSDRPPVAPPLPAAAGLALGVHALQMGLVTHQQLCDVLECWSQNRSQSIGQLLVDRAYLSHDDLAVLESLVARHSLHGSFGQPGTVRHAPAADDKDGAAQATNPVGGAATRRAAVQLPKPPTAELARSLLRTLRDSMTGKKDNASASTSRRGMNLSVLNVSHERFRILRPHGMGGLGVVSVAYDTELDREVAVKEMRLDLDSEEEVQRFMLEARVTGRLDHPGIPPVYALGYFEDGRPFYVMRLVDGVTLKQAVREFHQRFPPPNQSRQRSLQLRRLLGAIVSVCHTLRFAHSRGVLHRDVKPSNIMLGGYGETLLLDWGLAKSQEQAEPLSILDMKVHRPRRRIDDPDETGTGSVMGTPHYMSPEQASGDISLLNVRSDVYSVGATLYNVLTGKPPVDGATREEVLDAVRGGRVVPPQQVDARVPPELNAICMKAMALERGERFSDTGELASELEHWLADEPVLCYQEGSTRRLQRWIKAHQTSVAVCIALLTTALVGLTIGSIVVAQKHAEAITNAERASQESQRAQDAARDAQILVSEWLAGHVNDRLENVPGTERVRIQLMDELIDYHNRWLHEQPTNVQVRFDLARVIWQRARLHSAINHFDDALADLIRALSILDRYVLPENDSVRHARALRYFILLEQAALLQEWRPDAPGTEELVRENYFWISDFYEAHLQEPVASLAMAESQRQLAQTKIRKRDWVAAVDLLDAASTIYEFLLLPSNADELERQMVDGRQTAFRAACQCANQHARAAFYLGSYQQARQSVDKCSRLCAQTLRLFPGIRSVQLTELSNAGWAIYLDQVTGMNSQATLAKMHRINDQVSSMLAQTPNDRQCLRIAAELLEYQALLEQMHGQAARALDTAQAWLLCLDDLTQVLGNSLAEERYRALRRSAEASILTGDEILADIYDTAALHLRSSGCINPE